MDILRIIKEALNINKSNDTGEDVIPASGFIVQKALNDEYRWFGWATNKWRDRDEEILTDSAHREFLAYLDANPDKAPAFWTWHTPETERENRADWWDYADGFFMYSGVLTEEEAQAYLDEDDNTKDTVIGMSHGFIVLEKDSQYINRYRTFEVSDLPLKYAANPYTDFETIRKTWEDQDMFSAHKRAYLVERFGEEKVASMEESTESRKALLEELGVDWKEMEAEYEAQRKEEQEAQAKQLVTGIFNEVMDALNVEGLQKALEQLGEGVAKIEGLAAKMADLEDKVGHLMQTQDEQLQKALRAPAPITWDNSVQKGSGGEEDKDVAETTQNKQGDVETIEWFKTPTFGGN